MALFAAHVRIDEISVLGTHVTDVLVHDDVIANVRAGASFAAFPDQISLLGHDPGQLLNGHSTAISVIRSFTDVIDFHSSCNIFK